MSKAKKSIGVQINETKNTTGQAISEVVISGNSIGSVKEQDGKFIIETTNGETYKVANFDEGIQELIKAFHLHH